MSKDKEALKNSMLDIIKKKPKAFQTALNNNHNNENLNIPIKAVA